jgi:hypothetical protein
MTVLWSAPVGGFTGARALLADRGRLALKSAPLEYYCASASGLDVAGLGDGTLTSDERICRKFEEQ